MHALLNIAIRAARRAGDTIVRSMNRLDSLKVATKAHNEFVSEIDHLAEQEILNTIRKSYPNHGFLAEESGRHGEDEYVWIIDPLDGTTNFLHGFPVFAVSVALQHRGMLEHGVVYDPLRQELFTASRGAGAQLDGRRVRVSERHRIENALVGTGFPYRANQRWTDQYMSMMRSILAETAGIRRPGAAALDLAYVAAGRLDGFWEIGLKPWDLAAGVLLIREAGGRVSNLAGEQSFMESGNILAGNPKIFEVLQKLIKPHLTEELRL